MADLRSKIVEKLLPTNLPTFNEFAQSITPNERAVFVEMAFRGDPKLWAMIQTRVRELARTSAEAQADAMILNNCFTVQQIETLLEN